MLEVSTTKFEPKSTEIILLKCKLRNKLNVKNDG